MERLQDHSGELEQVHVTGMNRRGLRLEMVAALAVAIASLAMTATAHGSTGSAVPTTAISAQTSASSAQTNPSGATCSLTTVTVAVTGASGTPSGTVTINDQTSTSTTSIGSQTLNASGQASFTFALGNGPNILSAVYSGNSTYAPGSPSPQNTQTISSQCSASFAVTVSGLSPSNTLAAGQDGTGTVTVTPLPSYLGSLGGSPAFITVSCSGLPQLMSCSFTPADLEIVPGQNEAVTSALVIETQSQGTSRAAPPARLGRKGSPIAWAILLPGMLGFGGLAWGARKRRWLSRLALVALVGLVTSLATTACNPLYYYENHGPGLQPATPSGTYTVTVTGQSSNGVDAITNSTSMTVIVN